MSKRNIIFFILAIPLLLLGIIAAFWNPNWFKSDIEQQLETVPHVSIDFGDIEHSLFTPGDLAVNDIQLNGELVSGNIGSLSVKTQVNPLLSKQVIVDEIVLDSPNLNFNALALTQLPKEEAQPESQEPEAGSNEPLPIQQLLVKSIKIKNATLTDISEQKLFSVSGLNISLENIDLIENGLVLPPESMPPVSLNVSTGRTQIANYFTGILQLALQGNGKEVNLSNFEAKTKKSLISLNGTVSNPLETPTMSFNLNDSKIDLNEFSDLFADLPIKPAGAVNVSGKINDFLVSDSKEAMMQSLTGGLKLGFQQGKIQGIDINQMVSALKASRETDAKDIGSLLLTGPVGILATQFVDLGSGSLALTGETEIPQLTFNTQIEQGTLNLEDTAFATDEYRMALSGGVDLVTSQFKDFTFSLLDDKGCADIEQTLNGDFSNPEGAIADTLLNTVAAPLAGLFKGLTQPKKECKPVYQGNVKHPEGSKN